MQISLISTPAQEKTFLELPIFIYKGDPNWIRPLNKDIEEVFDQKKNKAFRFGKLQRWLLHKDGQCIGRIAAFVNKKYKSKGDDVPVGGVGFFECVEDEAAAFLLFDTAKKWLASEGMEAMDGPINFGERDRWWGLVVKGFIEPLYCMNYNPPYYQQFFENYGFQIFFKQICLGMQPKVPLEQKVWDRHAVIAADKRFHSEHLKKNNLKKYAEDFAEVYNKAWAGHGGLKQMEVKQVIMLFEKMKPVMDEKLIWFAYYENKAVAMFVNLPDLNQWFKYLNGDFNLLRKLQFLWLKTFKPNKKFTGLVFGVVPAWQGKGVDAYIIAETAKVVQQPSIPYESYEMQWIGDFNPKMLNVATSIGAVNETRKLCTYRYLFDRNKAFVRHPIL
jgi:hypothetical protein